MEFHVEDTGSGPAILFLHAAVADSRMWAKQIGLSGYRTIAFDRRGFGQTPWERGTFNDTTDTLTVMDQLGLDKATIVGCSMGGATALDLAIEHPERLESLVLVGAYPTGWSPDRPWEENPLEAEWMKAVEAGDEERLVDIDYQMWLVGYGRDEADVDPESKRLFYAMDRIQASSLAERMQDYEGFGKPLDPHLDEVRAPTLVVVGAHDEEPIVDAAHYLASRLSDRPAVEIEGAAHLPSLEQPAAFNTALTSFLTAN